MEYENTSHHRGDFNHKSLNPCSNGIRKYWTVMVKLESFVRLNPCSNGI